MASRTLLFMASPTLPFSFFSSFGFLSPFVFCSRRSKPGPHSMQASTPSLSSVSDVIFSLITRSKSLPFHMYNLVVFKYFRVVQLPSLSNFRTFSSPTPKEPIYLLAVPYSIPFKPWEPLICFLLVSMDCSLWGFHAGLGM